MTIYWLKYWVILPPPWCQLDVGQVVLYCVSWCSQLTFGQVCLLIYLHIVHSAYTVEPQYNEPGYNKVSLKCFSPILMGNENLLIMNIWYIEGIFVSGATSVYWDSTVSNSYLLSLAHCFMRAFVLLHKERNAQWVSVFSSLLIIHIVYISLST